MLQSTPIGSEGSFQARTSVAEWIRTGTYLVHRCTRTAVTLHVSHADFASASLCEVENLLNHCLEHLQELAAKQSGEMIRSEGWAIVTAYYLGFFAASALLRLLGEPIVFLTRRELAIPKQIAGVTPGPSQGAYGFRIGGAVSSIYTELTFTQTAKIHEATWKRVLSLLDQLRKDPAVLMQPQEADFYDSLCTQAFTSSGVGYDWPSFTRNQANYSAGLAYRLLKPDFSVTKFLEHWRLGTAEDIYPTFRAAFVRCSTTRDAFGSKAEMMVNVSLMVYLLARELYKDLASRRLTDRRWEDQRKLYKRRLAFREGEFVSLRV